jgi:hypothetical protein
MSCTGSTRQVADLARPMSSVVIDVGAQMGLFCG